MTYAKKILIVDDDPSIRQLIRLSLCSGERIVLEAATALEGLRLARETEPDVVLVDIGLPGRFDGFSLCEALSKEVHLVRTRIIVVSGYDEKEEIEHARRLGAQAYVIKPFSPEELRKVIVRVELNDEDMELVASKSVAHSNSQVA